jgi:hypothetical protein
MLRRIYLVVVAAAAIWQSAAAEEFDRTLLKGRWVELFEGEKPPCWDALIFEHELSDDGKILVTRFTRNWLFSELSGNRVSFRKQPVVRMTRNTLVVKNEGEPYPGEPVEWEFIFDSPTQYRLRGLGLETDEGDFVRRQRCPGR